ncbi:MAG TPA: lipopolysaccharide heptosyltransferase I [Burkholderiales bacterium]
MKILFVKTSSLGDVVHQCPAVSEAARNLPAAEVDWVVEEAFAGVPAMHASVRRVIPLALRRWRRALFSPTAWREFASFRESVAAERYDAIVDTQGLIKSALVARLANGPVHGLDRASEREPLARFFYRHVHPVQFALHPVERNRLLTAQALGYAVEGPPEYGLRIEAPQRVARCIFLTMTSRPEKLWPEARWIELGRSLAMPIVLPWGTAGERARAERIARAIGAGAVVAPSMALRELAGLFAASSGVVGIDTGLTHLAAALGCRTVGLYCGTDPARYGLRAQHAVNLGALGRPPAVDEARKALQ